MLEQKVTQIFQKVASAVFTYNPKITKFLG